MNINEIFAPLFEFFHYSAPFSDDLYQEGLYSSLGLSGILLSLLLVITFYFIINRPSFSGFRHWLIILGVNFVLASIIGTLLPRTKLTVIGIEYELIEYITFGFKNAIISTLFFIVWTYCLKWWYGNARGTPKIFGKF